MPPRRGRKQCLQLVKAVKFYLETNDGYEEIDDELDEAFDALAEVSVRMHNFWLHAKEQRERFERELAKTEGALELARQRATKLTPESVVKLKHDAKMQRAISQIPAEEKAQLLQQLKDQGLV